MRSKRAFSTFRILPRSGKIAWNLESRPPLAEPPAESPSTKKSSHKAGSFSRQAASLSGRELISRPPFLRFKSRALRIASRTRADSMIFIQITSASFGFSSKKSLKLSAMAESTALAASELTSLSLVCEENLGSGIFTEITAVKPSRESSPEVLTLCFFKRPDCSKKLFSVRVKVRLKPIK